MRDKERKDCSGKIIAVSMRQRVGFYCVVDKGQWSKLRLENALELNVTAPPQFLQGTIMYSSYC